MAQDAVGLFDLLVLLAALDDVFRRDTALREVDISCSTAIITLLLRRRRRRRRRSSSRRRTFVFINTDDHNDFVIPNPDQLLHAPDPTPRQLAERDHAVDVIVLEQLDVDAHFSGLSLRLLLVFFGPQGKQWGGKKKKRSITCLILTITTWSNSGSLFS